MMESHANSHVSLATLGRWWLQRRSGVVTVFDTCGALDTLLELSEGAFCEPERLGACAESLLAGRFQLTEGDPPAPGKDAPTARWLLERARAQAWARRGSWSEGQPFRPVVSAARLRSVPLLDPNRALLQAGVLARVGTADPEVAVEARALAILGWFEVVEAPGGVAPGRHESDWLDQALGDEGADVAEALAALVGGREAERRCA